MSINDPLGRIPNSTTLNVPQLPGLPLRNPLRPVLSRDFQLCCVTTPGFYPNSGTATFLSSRDDQGSSYNSIDVRVADNVPAFSMTNPSFTLGVPEPHAVRLVAPITPSPALTGTVQLTRAGNPVNSVAIDASGNGPSISYTPTVAEMTGICFTAQYSGNTAYKALRDTKCYPVNPTTSQVSISSSTGSCFGAEGSTYRRP